MLDFTHEWRHNVECFLFLSTSCLSNFLSCCIIIWLWLWKSKRFFYFSFRVSLSIRWEWQRCEDEITNWIKRKKNHSFISHVYIISEPMLSEINEKNKNSFFYIQEIKEKIVNSFRIHEATFSKTKTSENEFTEYVLWISRSVFDFCISIMRKIFILHNFKIIFLRFLGWNDLPMILKWNNWINFLWAFLFVALICICSQAISKWIRFILILMLGVEYESFHTKLNI